MRVRVPPSAPCKSRPDSDIRCRASCVVRLPIPSLRASASRTRHVETPTCHPAFPFCRNCTTTPLSVSAPTAYCNNLRYAPGPTPATVRESSVGLTMYVYAGPVHGGGRKPVRNVPVREAGVSRDCAPAHQKGVRRFLPLLRRGIRLAVYRAGCAVATAQPAPGTAGPVP